MVNKKLKEKLDEEELTKNYDCWMNRTISDAQYFREVNRIKTQVY